LGTVSSFYELFPSNIEKKLPVTHTSILLYYIQPIREKHYC